MLANLAMDFASIQSKDGPRSPRLFDQEPVFAPSLQFVRGISEDAVIRYKANPDYSMGRPH